MMMVLQQSLFSFLVHVYFAFGFALSNLSKHYKNMHFMCQTA
jgi:hypothetical protein